MRTGREKPPMLKTNVRDHVTVTRIHKGRRCNRKPMEGEVESERQRDSIESYLGFAHVSFP